MTTIRSILEVIDELSDVRRSIGRKVDELRTGRQEHAGPPAAVRERRARLQRLHGELSDLEGERDVSLLRLASDPANTKPGGRRSRRSPAHLMDANGRPTGERGYLLYWRVGADVVVNNAIRILNVT